MKVIEYGLKVLSIVMNAIGVVGGIVSFSYTSAVLSMVLLIVDLRDFKIMCKRDFGGNKVKEE